MWRKLQRLNDLGESAPPCWACGQALQASHAAPAPVAVCGSCGTVQPPNRALCHFARLALPRRFDQRAADIETAHAVRLAAVHPDRFSRTTRVEQGFAAEHAARLNDALRVLVTPHSRLTYLLAERGLHAGETPLLRLRPSDADRVELLELRAALEELDGRDATVERSRLSRGVQERFEQLLSELGAVVDETPEGAPLPFAAGRLGHLHALRRLIDEVSG